MKIRLPRYVVSALLLGFAANAFAQGATSPEQLAMAYAAALGSQNEKAFIDLFALSREQDRSVAEQQFRTQSQMRVVSTRILPFAAHEQRYRKAMARLGKSDATPPEAWAEVVFAPVRQPNGAMAQETALLAVVCRDGRFFVSW